MTGFVTKKISHRTRTLGSVLKSARAKAEVTLEQVEAQTRIAAKYLRALEEGRYEDLPADAYNVGFVRGYAGFLKLPVDKIS
jgi:cytoskeleton protein RodZ